MTKWRYEILRLLPDQVHIGALDKHGEMGWELVNVLIEEDEGIQTYLFVFKQPEE